MHTNEALNTLYHKREALERRAAHVRRLLDRRHEYLDRIDWSGMTWSDLERDNDHRLDLTAQLRDLEMARDDVTVEICGVSWP